MTPEEAKQFYEECGSIRAASRASGIPRTTFRRLLKKSGLEVDDNKTDDLTLKVRKQEKIIQNLSRELKKAQNELLTNQEVRQHILQIKEKDSGAVPAWTVQQKDHSLDDNIPCAILSDTHWGETIDSRQVFGLNEFNMTIGERRLSHFINNIFFLIDNHLAPRKYPGLVFCLGGDMISGDIHQELSETNEHQVLPVFLDLYQNLRYAIWLLAEKFGKVFIPCVYGNHGRLNKKPQHKNQAYKNLDWMLYHLLADYFQDDDRVSFLVGDDDEVQFQVLNHTYRLTHGAQFRGGTGFVGSLAPISRGEHKKRIVSQSQNTMYDTLVIGHFHRCMWLPNTIVNGSLCGYNEFAADNNLEYEAPKQMFWLTDPKYGKTSPLEVWCDEPKSELEVQQFEQVVF
jgi:hypothetical protein